MDFETLFTGRRSVRAWEERPVQAELKERLLKAALRAPTAGNLMLYSILEIDDPKLKGRLAETCDHQPFIAKAPLVFVFLADYARMMAYYEAWEVPGLLEKRGEAMLKPREADLLLSCCDALISAQSLAVAAESQGLGSCYIGDVMENWEIHRDLLGLPRYTFPIAMLCLGWPTARQKARAQPSRLDVSLVVRRNGYRMPDREELRALYGEDRASAAMPAGASGVENPALALYERKFSAGYSLEMRRSVAAMLRDWGE
jgi:nitroreductase